MKTQEVGRGHEPTWSPGRLTLQDNVPSSPSLPTHPPSSVVWGFFSSNHSSNARAPSGAPGQCPFALFFFHLSTFPIFHVLPLHVPASPAVGLRPCDQFWPMSCGQRQCPSFPEVHRCTSSRLFFSCCGNLGSHVLRWWHVRWRSPGSLNHRLEESFCQPMMNFVCTGNKSLFFARMLRFQDWFLSYSFSYPG